MKKWGIAAALVFLLTSVIIGCGANNEEIQSGFMPLVESKATPDSIRTATEYIDRNIGKTDQQAGSLILIAYEDYLLKYLNTDADWTAIETLYPYWDSDSKTLDADKIKTDEAKNLYSGLTEAGFKFISREGTVEPIIDYGLLNDKYGRHTTEALQELYAIKTMESSLPMAEDAALMISWEELAMRAYSVEQYIKTFGEDPMTIEDARFLYGNYINAMMLGMNNTPIFDYETDQFSEDAKAAYERFVREHPKSTTAWMLREYMSYIASIDYRMDYSDQSQSKAFLETCSWLVSETGKKAME